MNRRGFDRLVEIQVGPRRRPADCRERVRRRYDAEGMVAPETVAGILSDIDAGVGKDALSRVTGRPATPFQTTIIGFIRSRPV